MTEEGIKKLKNLIRSHSANKIDNYNRWGENFKKSKKKSPKESIEQENKSKHKNDKCFS